MAPRRRRFSAILPPAGAHALTLSEAASFLGSSPSTLRRQIAAGELRAYNLGSDHRIATSEFVRYLRSCRASNGSSVFDLLPPQERGAFDDRDIASLISERAEFSVADVAQLLRASTRFVQQEISRGRLPLSARRSVITRRALTRYASQIGALPSALALAIRE